MGSSVIMQKLFFLGTLKIGQSYGNFPQREKFLKIRKKFKNIFVKLKMGIAHSIFNKFFANTPIIIV